MHTNYKEYCNRGRISGAPIEMLLPPHLNQHWSCWSRMSRLGHSEQQPGHLPCQDTSCEYFPTSLLAANNRDKLPHSIQIENVWN